MTKTYKFLIDAGHGWLEVPIKELRDIKEDISEYSYISFNGEKAYLEEDSDASKFIN